MQYKLYGGLPPHSDNETSKAAAISMLDTADTLRAVVFRFIREQGEHGATDDEIEINLHLSHQTASARRRELVLLDAIGESGKLRKTRSGRNAKVWTVMP